VDPKALNTYKRAVAEMFDARIDYSRSEIHSRLADRLVRLGAPQPNERVLDIATGTGFVATPAARLVGERGTVIGVDISAGMLDQAAKAVAAAGVRNVELVQADAEALDYPADSFDLIFCCNALPYLTDVPAALRHWHSLLRPGGRLAFNCWAEHSYATGHLLRIVAARHGIPVAVVGQDTGTPERCRSLLAAVGFIQPEIVTEPTATFFTTNHLETFPDMAVKNPLYGITPSDTSRLSGLRDEYIAEARSPSVQKDIDTEVGAYFVLAHKPPASPS
jgi:ubiquinone/menaquinone biosynthesis C-methylase UbiE